MAFVPLNRLIDTLIPAWRKTRTTGKLPGFSFETSACFAQREVICRTWGASSGMRLARERASAYFISSVSNTAKGLS
jgi:hypothetical protein